MRKLPFTIGQEIHPGVAKAIEETSELGVELAKLVMNQGEWDYWGGRDLRRTISEECSDAIAAIYFLSKTSDLDEDLITRRTEAKIKLFEAWHNGNENATLEEFLVCQP